MSEVVVVASFTAEPGKEDRGARDVSSTR